VPFIGFFASDDPEFAPADDIAERPDQAATAIPRAILVHRKLAKRRAADGLCHTFRRSTGGLSVREIPRARQHGLQQRSWPPLSWIGGHDTVPNEQNTQQSPGLGRSSVPQPLQS
jgi:hypothetical protein